MIVEFLEPAHIEYQEAIEFYNLQSEGLGDKFIIEVDRTISIIKNIRKVLANIPAIQEKLS